MTKEEGAIDKPSPHGERRRNRGDRLPMKTLRPKSFDVAERAGVSQSTVSRALRNSPGVNAETRARVSTAARELGYVVDRHASSLRLKSSETLALVTICRPGEDRSAINPFYFALLGSIAAATSARGFNLLVSFQESPDNFRADFVASGLADAMIVIGTTSNRAAWDYFARAQASGLDFVCWGSPGSPFHWMRSENDEGGQLAADVGLSRAGNAHDEKALGGRLHARVCFSWRRKNVGNSSIFCRNGE